MLTVFISVNHTREYLIRDNANLLILFKQDDTNLKYVYNVNADMSYQDFSELCHNCWQQKWIPGDRQGQCIY